MSVDGGVAVAVAVAHTPTWGKIGLKLKYAGNLSVGQGQKRKASEAEDGDGNGEEGGVSEDSSSKKGRKRSRRGKRERRERMERMAGSPGDEGQRERENMSEEGGEGEEREKEKKSRGSKDKASKETSGTEDANAPLSDKDKAPAPAPPSPLGSNNTVSSSSGSPSKPSLRKRTAEDKRLLRKSVTFTSDTKATDGDSIKTLYQNYDPFAHYDSYQKHINNYPTNELPEGFDDIKPKFEPIGKHKKFDEAEGEKADNHKKPEQQERKKKRRKKKAKKSKKVQGESESAKNKGENVMPQLSYLLTYHTCREAWKFEKSKQNWILRNAFNPSMIPEEGYADALKSYIVGVRSTFARDRLLFEANEIVKHGKDTISKDGDKLDVMDQKNNVTRAKLVLAALGHGDDDEGDEGGEGGEGDSSSSDEEK